MDRRSRKRAEAAARAREARRRQIMKEVNLGALNTERYRRLWREMMMRIKMPDIKRNVEVAWHTFDRILDVKDYRIGFLMEALEEADEQTLMNERSQAEAIDRMLTMQETRIKNDTQVFLRNVKDASLVRSEELERITWQRVEGEALVQKIASLSNRFIRNYMSNARSMAISKVEAFIEDGKNERRVEMAEMEKKLRNLWDELQKILTRYRQGTDDRRATYKILNEKDIIDRRIIKEQSSRLAVLFDEIATIREKILSYESNKTNELRQITQEENLFQKTYRQTDQRFHADLRRDKNRVTVMSIEYNRAVKRLNALLDKAKRIFTLLQICRKYETQSEKVLLMSDPECDLIIPKVHSTMDYLSLDRIHQEFQSSIIFWRRLGNARSVAMNLRIERDQLLAQANYLKEAVKNRISDVPCG